MPKGSPNKPRDFSPIARGRNVLKALELLAQCEVIPQSDAIWANVEEQVQHFKKQYTWKKQYTHPELLSQTPTETGVLQGEKPSHEAASRETAPHTHTVDPPNAKKLELGWKWSNEVWNSKPEMIADAKRLYELADKSGMPMTDRERNFIYDCGDPNDPPKMNERGQCTMPTISDFQIGLFHKLVKRLDQHLHKLSLEEKTPPTK